VAGYGNDTVDAGAGNDTVLGGDGEDTIQGGDGDDILKGNDDNDVISGGAGNDCISGDGSTGCGSGTGDDVIAGGLGEDFITGGAGDDEIVGDGDGPGIADNDAIYGGSGNDFLDGDSGAEELITFSQEWLAWWANPPQNPQQNPEPSLVFTNKQFVYSGTGTDCIDGGTGNDTIAGGYGNDQLAGGTGDDTFVFKYSDLASHDTICDFRAGTACGGAGIDQIDLSQMFVETGYQVVDPVTGLGTGAFKHNGLFNDFDAVLAAGRNVGSDWVLDLVKDTSGNVVQSVKLIGVQESQLIEGDFMYSDNIT
jgi:Ca2+-binding RTX toxin-like protein